MEEHSGVEDVRFAAEVWRWAARQTSVFPDSEQGTFVPPVKKAVRTAQRVTEGDVVDVTLSVRPEAL